MSVAPGGARVVQFFSKGECAHLEAVKYISGVMAAPLTVLATDSRMYCKTPNSEDLQRAQLLGKTTPKVSTPLLSTTLLRLRTEKFAVQYT